MYFYVFYILFRFIISGEHKKVITLLLTYDNLFHLLRIPSFLGQISQKHCTTLLFSIVGYMLGNKTVNKTSAKEKLVNMYHQGRAMHGTF